MQSPSQAQDYLFRLSLSGMHCSACSARVERYLNSLEEIEKASVSLATNTATAHFVPNLFINTQEIQKDLQPFDVDTFLEKVQERIQKMGFEAELLSVQIPYFQNSEENSSLGHGVFKEQVGTQILQDLSSNTETATQDNIAQKNQVNKTEERKLPRYIIEAEKDLQERQRKLIIEVILATIVMCIAMGSHVGLPLPHIIDMHANPVNFVLIQFFLTVPVLWFGRSFYRVGLRSLLQGSPNMDTLVALGTGAAFLYSVWSSYHVLIAQNAQELHMALMGIYYESAAMLIALISFGKYLEVRSKRKTHDAIRSLMDLKPATATIVRKNNPLLSEKFSLQADASMDFTSSIELEEIPVEHIHVGDYLFIKSGNQIPVDGVIVDGVANLDVSALTGEFMPITVEKGQNVSSGSLCIGQPFYMQAQRVGEDTVLAKIIALVQEAQGSKAPIAQLADFVSLYFVPFVISFACLAGVLWYFVGNLPFVQALQIFVAVMVVACPCALGLATPMSIMVATGRAAKLGLLIKNGTVLELAGKIDAIVFDKTGTLTKGKPTLMQEYICPVNDAYFHANYAHVVKKQQENEDFQRAEKKNLSTQNDAQWIQNVHTYYLLTLATALEQKSDHPISKSFLEFVAEIRNDLKNNLEIPYNLETVQFKHFEEMSGRGLYALLEKDGLLIPYYMGNKAFMLENDIVLNQSEMEVYDRIIEEGKSPLLFAQGKIQKRVDNQKYIDEQKSNSEQVSLDYKQETELTTITSERQNTHDLSREASTLFFGNTHKILGIFSITDMVREESATLIKELNARGVATYLLSGDNKASVLKLAEKIGIPKENVTAEVMPSDKEANIVALQKRHKTVAMVGDGINDAPALARSHVGMVMGSGMDVAMEAGDIVLLGGISGVLTTLRLSHATILNIKISLFWAFFYNLLLLPVAAGVLLLFGGPTLSPMLAGAAMSLSSFSVVTNALRLRKFK